MTKAKTTDAVGYVRMSTDKQEDSPARQKEQVTRWASSNGYRITHWYEDHGKTGTESANRPEFKQLLADAKSGKVAVLIVSEISRVSREDALEQMLHWRLLSIVGCKLLSVARGGEYRMDDMGGVITLLVDAFSAHSESVNIGKRCASGLRRKLEAGQLKIMPLFGFDREFLDQSGAVVKRVHCDTKFQKPREWTVRRVVTADVKAVNAIRWAFESYAHEGLSMAQIADEFDRRGIVTGKGSRFHEKAVRNFLSNPAYCGDYVAGRHQSGKFATVLDEGEVRIIRDAHPGIVDRETFELTSRMIEMKVSPIQHRGVYLLGRMLTCSHCGNTLSGMYRHSKHGKEARFYHCWRRHDRTNEDCPRPTVRADRIEEKILRVMRDYVFTPQNVEQLMTVAREEQAAPESQEAQQLRAIRENIERGTANLLKAPDDATFAAMSSMLSEWKEQERELLKGMASDTDPTERGEMIEAVANMTELRDHLSEADPRKLSLAIRECMERITIGRKQCDGETEWYGQITLRRSCWTGSPIPIAHADLGEMPLWRTIPAMLHEAGEEVRWDSIAKRMKCNKTSVFRALNKAIDRGLVRRSSTKGFYFAPSAK